MAGQRSRRWANLDSVLVHLPVLTDYHDDIQASPDQIEEGGGVHQPGRVTVWPR